MNGNPTTYKGQTLTYDAANHLCGIPTTAGPVLTAGYYADGKRAWKQVGAGAKTYFLYDGDALVCELASTTGGYTTTATNLWGPDGLLARNTAGGTRWYEYDLQGNVIQRYQDSGALTPIGTNPAPAPARYDAIGNLQAGTLDSTDPYGYNGQWGYYTDQETELILCTHRYYDPTLGRWLTEDPIGYAGGMNLYGYCGEDPVGGIDPLGETLWPLIDWKQVLKTAKDTVVKVKQVVINKGKDYFNYINDHTLAPLVVYEATGMANNANDPGWRLAWELLASWANGTAQSNQLYGPDTLQTKQLRMSQGINIAKHSKKFLKGEDGRFGWDSKNAAYETFIITHLQNATIAQVGAYVIHWHFDKKNKTVTFTVDNDLTVKSFYYHLTPSEWDSTRPGEAMATVTQQFVWTEPIP